MIVNIADNITSPLGPTTALNVAAIRSGRSGLALSQRYGLPAPAMASLMGEEATTGDDAASPISEGATPGARAASPISEGATPRTGATSAAPLTYERLALRSIGEALSHVPTLDVGSPRTCLILASTKAQTTGPDGEPMGVTAQRIAAAIGLTTRPLTISDACISGLAAQIVAARLLAARRYDTAIVTGCDVQSHFIISGFRALGALSDEPCRPYDADRFGLNLGEAAATIVWQRIDPTADAQPWLQPRWAYASGAIRTDAYHISAPSRTAEGAYQALAALMEQEQAPSAEAWASHLACLSTHGTATLYNDEMEAKAIARAGLSAIPVSALKGYYGHTMGAAGVMETVVTMHAVAEGWVPGTRGFASPGTSRPLNIAPDHRPTDRRELVKMMSGFGGGNAAAHFVIADGPTGMTGMGIGHDGAQAGAAGPSMGKPEASAEAQPGHDGSPSTIGDGPLHVRLTPADGPLATLYKAWVGDYPKFYKMDPLARLAFLASERLLQAEARERGTARFVPRSDRAIVLMGRTASLVADRRYSATIQPGPDYYPSPADFVYTLPNIAAGEIAIRNAYHGECHYVGVDSRDEGQMTDMARQCFADPAVRSVVVGWIDYAADDDYECDLWLVEGQPD